MPSRLRKLIGTLLLLAFVAAYIFAAMLVAVAMLPTAGKVAEFAFYAVAGLAWALPAGLIVHWMHR